VEKLISVSELKSPPDKTTNILSVMNPDFLVILVFLDEQKNQVNAKL
jgi:hypothetical protein